MMRKASWFDWFQRGCIVILLLVFFGAIQSVSAHDGHEHIINVGTGGTNDELSEIDKEIAELQAKIKELQKESDSLSATIKFLDSKILLTKKEIEKSEKEISLLERQISELDQRIEGLELNLHELSAELIRRVQEQYKRSATDSISVVFATTGLTNFFKEHKYISQVRAHTQELLLSTEEKRQQYDEEKERKEVKQAEVEALKAKQQAQRVDLERQQSDKQRLLVETKNSEAIYQRQLAQALAEKQAIDQALVSSVKEGPIKRGEPVALVGNTGYPDCSTGPHLHFEIRKGGSWVDPAPYLRNKTVIDEQNGGTWNVGNGDWDWPLSDPIRMTQHYGKTPYSYRYRYSGGIHTGYDMGSNSSKVIRAPADGVLYSSAQKCGNSTIKIKYIDHGDGLLSLYLHVQ